MKIYLSGPMSGMIDDNAPLFLHAAKRLRDLGHEVVVPHELDKTHPVEDNWGACLGRDVEIMANGEFKAIVLLPYWQRSKGARLELALALLLKLEVFTYDPTDRTLEFVPRSYVADQLKEVLR